MNVGVTLLCIHRAITRAIVVVKENCQNFQANGFTDTQLKEGFICYARSLVTGISAHHLTEDEVVFPYLKEKFADAPYDTLADQHKLLEPLLPKLEAAISNLETSENSTTALKEIRELVTKLEEVWTPHIELEQKHSSVELLEKIMPPEEHLRMAKIFSEHSQQHTKPEYLVVPFFFYNLSDPDRNHMAEAFPPIVTQQLIPIVWKDKWAPMKPFLLS